MHIVPRGNGSAVERCRRVVPSPQGGFDLLVDAVSNRLHNFGLDNITQRVDCDFNDHVADQISRELAALNRRIGINNRISDMHLVTNDRAVD